MCNPLEGIATQRTLQGATLHATQIATQMQRRMQRRKDWGSVGSFPEQAYAGHS